MKRIIFLILLLSGIVCKAQDIVLEGRVTNPEGIGVEYATIGVPGTRYGTLTGSEGRFTLALPQGCNDTLSVSHVSYSEAKIAAATFMSNGNIVIGLEYKALDSLVVFDGKRKKAKLINKGMRVAGAATSYDVNSLGNEVGSIISTKNAFEVEEIKFTVLSNKINDAKLSVSIYSIDEGKGEFHNRIHRPIYADIAVSNSKKEYCISPQETIILDAGEYFVAVKLVDGKSDNHMHEKMLLPLYLKKSYIRKGATEHPEKIPVNIGLQIKGAEIK